jgi:hypothetical protein
MTRRIADLWGWSYRCYMIAQVRRQVLLVPVLSGLASKISSTGTENVAGTGIKSTDTHATNTRAVTKQENKSEFYPGARGIEKNRPGLRAEGD